MKFVIFDLDETLGYFKQLYYLFSVLKKINASYSITQPIFNRVLDLFPEFLRPKILDILQFLKQQKQFTPHTYLILYTNNTHPKWTTYIQAYLEYKLLEGEEPLSFSPSASASASFFDKIIHAQKQATCRQHQRKHLEDLFRCIDYASHSPICYIDNEYHPGMKSRQTYYCKLSSYVHNLSLEVIADRLQHSNLLETILPGVHPTVFANIYRHYSDNKYTRGLTEAEYRYEIRTSQELLLKIRIFFMNNTTHKRRHTYSNFGISSSSSSSVTNPSSASSSSAFPSPFYASLPSSPSGESNEDEVLDSRQITRISEPLFNYYQWVGATPTPNVATSSKKTKKHRRVL